MPEDSVRLSIEPNAPESLRDVVRDRLNMYNVAATGHSDWAPLSIFLRGRHDEIRGGLLGSFWGGWLHVTFLWVADELRLKRHGTALLDAAEGEARARGCSGVFLETFSFQAPDFYKKRGYEEFSTLEGYPIEHRQHFLRKRL